MKRLIIPFITIMMLLAVSCVKDDGPVTSETDGSDWASMPDMSLENTTLTLFDGDSDPIIVTAEKADFWTDDSHALITGIGFIQKDGSGSTLMTGSADRAEVDTENSVFSLEGNIVLESVRDGLTIRADECLTFSAETEEIEAPGEVEVLNEGAFFSGTGFYANLKKEEYSFSRINEGRFDV